MKWYLSLLMTTLWTVCAQTIHAQRVEGFTYQHLGQKEGLNSQRIYSLQQTLDGAIWWSAKNGVERYNGVSVKHYQLGSQSMVSILAGRTIKLSSSLTEKEIQDLLAFDNKGYIYRYQSEGDTFVEIANINILIKDDIQLNDILQTDQGIWLATNFGVYFLRDDKASPIVKNVNACCIVRTNKHLLFCTKEGVLQYNGGIHSIPKPHVRMQKILPYHIESGYYDALYNKVWLGGYTAGLRVLSFDGAGRMTRSDYVSPEAGVDISHNPVRSICAYDSKTLLVGIDGFGVHVVSRQPSSSGKYTWELLFDANEGAHGVLHGNGIYALLRDAWGNIIVGSYSGGIDIARPVGSTPAIFQHIRDNQQSLLNDRVNCVDQLVNGTLVMGTDNGVSLHNPYNRQWKHTCYGTVVIDLCKTPNGNILASTYGKGVYEITSNGQARQLYTVANGALQDDHVYKLMYDKKGDLWMGCLDGMLVQKTASGFRYHEVRYVNDMLQLPNGDIAVGTAYGVYLVSPSTGKISELPYDAGDKNDVNKFAQCLYLNNDNELWIGTDGGGIYIYHFDTKKCVLLTKDNGLPSNCISSIIKDVRGRIMIATEEGLSFMTPKSTKAVNVNFCYGVEREYSRGAAVKMHNGHILYGSTTGALIINPENVQAINYTAKLRILDTNGRQLRLSYDERTFDLHYECINLRNQSDIVYQYKVGDGEWSQPTSQQSIRFTNLEAGTHDLHLRSISRTCGDVLDEVQLELIIAQPWWNSWWMWMIYIGLVVLAFYGAWRVYQLHTKYMRLVVSNPSLSVDIANDDAKKVDSIETDSEESSEFIGKVTTIVVDHLSDTDFNIDRLCREMAMSRTLFYIKLKSFTGKSPQDFIRIIRLERAAALLRSGRSVSETAVLAGFDNAKYFSTVFKKYFGVSPSKYV